jgi:DNA-directed RNA polymerase subunit L
MANYEIILKNTKEVVNKSLYEDENFIKTYSTGEITIRDFYLSFTTYGNIRCNTMMRNCFDNLILRLETIRLAVQNTQPGDNNDLVAMTVDNKKTSVLIRGEDHTIGKLLTRTMFELDPNVGLVKDSLEHPSNRTIILHIVHSQPLKLLDDAFAKCVEIFTDLKTYFPSTKGAEDEEPL